jgi:hypothetical protein
MLRFLAFATALLLQAPAAPAQEAQPAPRAGDLYEIRRVSDTTFTVAGSESSGNSHDRDMLMERVIAVRDTGVELEFDLPADATAENRAAVWQFPARVLRPPQGALQLLNGPELEARVARWLERARWPRTICGHWIFTWNAFRIDCDPQTVIQTLTAVDLGAITPHDGALHREAGAREPAMLRRETQGPDGAVFVAEMEVDPETLRREYAESEAATLEILGDSPATRAYREERAPRRVSGTIRIRFETDAAGHVRRRTKVTELTIETANGERETRTVTETLERRLVSRAGP